MPEAAKLIAVPSQAPESILPVRQGSLQEA